MTTDRASQLESLSLIFLSFRYTKMGFNSNRLRSFSFLFIGVIVSTLNGIKIFQDKSSSQNRSTKWRNNLKWEKESQRSHSCVCHVPFSLRVDDIFFFSPPPARIKKWLACLRLFFTASCAHCVSSVFMTFPLSFPPVLSPLPSVFPVCCFLFVVIVGNKPASKHQTVPLLVT